MSDTDPLIDKSSITETRQGLGLSTIINFTNGPEIVTKSNPNILINPSSNPDPDKFQIASPNGLWTQVGIKVVPSLDAEGYDYMVNMNPVGKYKDVTAGLQKNLRLYYYDDSELVERSLNGGEFDPETGNVSLRSPKIFPKNESNYYIAVPFVKPGTVEDTFSNRIVGMVITLPGQINKDSAISVHPYSLLPSAKYFNGMSDSRHNEIIRAFDTVLSKDL